MEENKFYLLLIYNHKEEEQDINMNFSKENVLSALYNNYSDDWSLNEYDEVDKLVVDMKEEDPFQGDDVQVYTAIDNGTLVKVFEEELFQALAEYIYKL